MAKESHIQWTDATWNPWVGCTKISEGCRGCYMYREQNRWGRNPAIIRRTSDATFFSPLKWKESKLVFTCSYSDFFIEEADDFRQQAWDVIRRTPHLTYQILTKRPERIEKCLPPDWGEGWDNVWLGVTVENEQTISRTLILSGVKSKVRFISAEPLLGPVGFVKHFNNQLSDYFHWVIVGGESGHKTGKYKYRECKEEWVQNLITELKVANVPVFMKQTGNHIARELGLRDSFGGDYDEFPHWMKFHEWPKEYSKKEDRI